MYGTYAFTAASLLIKFQISIAIQDTLWGTFLYGITPFLTFYLIGLCDKKKDNDEARVRLD